MSNICLQRIDDNGVALKRDQPGGKQCGASLVRRHVKTVKHPGQTEFWSCPMGSKDNEHSHGQQFWVTKEDREEPADTKIIFNLEKQVCHLDNRVLHLEEKIAELRALANAGRILDPSEYKKRKIDNE